MLPDRLRDVSLAGITRVTIINTDSSTAVYQHKQSLQQQGLEMHGLEREKEESRACLQSLINFFSSFFLLLTDVDNLIDINDEIMYNTGIIIQRQKKGARNGNLF